MENTEVAQVFTEWNRGSGAILYRVEDCHVGAGTNASVEKLIIYCLYGIMLTDYYFY